jgi:hypothetical protein
MAGLSPSMSTGGMPRPMRGNVSTGISSTLKMHMGKIGGQAIGGQALGGGGKLTTGAGSFGVGPKAGGGMPKIAPLKMTASPKMSAMNLGGGTKPTTSSSSLKSLGATLKSLISKPPKAAPATFGSGQNNGLNMSSSVGAPASSPNTSFFGSSNPSAGAPGLGM